MTRIEMHYDEITIRPVTCNDGFPVGAPTGLVVGHFTDPEGNLIGLAATA